MTQLRLIPGEHPDRLIERAKAEHNSVATVCLFSGGNDSTVLAHRCRDHYESLAFIDTGTAIPGVRDFVENYAVWIGKPLIVMESGDMYRRLVLGKDVMNPGPDFRPLGFPGPRQHGRAYVVLKERQLEALRRRLKDGHPRSARVLYLTGVRRAESERRRARPAIHRSGGTVFASPLIDWSDQDMREYRAEHRLPQSDVAALIHRSGECNCGAFAAPGEREMLRSLWPDWFERTIASVEREAKAHGIPACRWGERPGTPDDGDGGPLCSDCQLRIELSQSGWGKTAEDVG